MYIKIDTLIKKYKLNIKGIIHIGAHICEERTDYNKAGITDDNIVWIEGNPNLVRQINMKNKNIKILNYLVSDKNDELLSFYISNNGQSSSILELGTHKTHHPSVYYTHEIKMKTKTLKKIYEENNLEKNFANFLNIDIQGAELLALKGMGELLDNFDYLYLEVNKEEVYKNCGLVTDIDTFLEKWNFKRVESFWPKKGRIGWGDAFYMKI